MRSSFLFGSSLSGWLLRVVGRGRDDVALKGAIPAGERLPTSSSIPIPCYLSSQQDFKILVVTAVDPSAATSSRCTRHQPAAGWCQSLHGRYCFESDERKQRSEIIHVTQSG